MPAKKGSKKLVFKQSLLGTFQKNKKSLNEMEEKIKQQELALVEYNKILIDNELSLKQIAINIDNERRKVEHKRHKLKCLQTQSALLSSSSKSESRKERNSVVISVKVIKKKIKSNRRKFELKSKASA